ncbi:hypothetical protein [Nocardioides sp. TF02-7]|uniref:hypothetical protein n=1 Tax=Nocardioides sp. TF02-7 TaxID=2917724 RepID=UPI001F059DD0|nr:hypothetical protein [Nocardioides sp. TF02-7]UMG94004.1 hypothetical protein MF408_07975 [Nocardioides sp. TF02-7]
MPRKRWSRYTPPSDPRTEDGTRVARKGPAPSSTKLIWAGLGVSTLLVGGIVVGVVTNGDDEPDDDVDTSLLDPVAIAETLERAEAEITVGEPDGVPALGLLPRGRVLRPQRAGGPDLPPGHLR